MRSLRTLIHHICRLLGLSSGSGQQRSPMQNFGVQARQTLTVMATQIFTPKNPRQWQNPWEKPLPVLEIINPCPTSSHEGKHRRVDLQYEASWPLFLGNSSQCQITVRNDRVSRSHVRIDRQSNQYILSSPQTTTNGTFKGFGWNRWRRVDNEQGSYPLKHGDAFVLGPLGDKQSVILRFWAPEALHVRIGLAVRRLVVTIASAVITIVLFLILLLTLTWSRIPGQFLPESVDAPLVFYANDRQTSITGDALPVQPLFLSSLAEFPDALPKAVLASEDSQYFWHPGVNPVSIVRATLFNLVFMLQGKDYREGGSTLTQQVARTVYSDWVGREATLLRKLREAAVALKLNFSHPKDEILKTYLNTVFLGRGNNGFGEAAQDYFKKPVQELNLSEITTLVAMLPGPNGFDLCGVESAEGLEALRGYRDRVLKRMQEKRMVDPSPSRLVALNNLFDPSLCSHQGSSNALLPRVYNSLLYRELYNLLGSDEVDLGNLIIETTLDPKAQRLAQDLINQNVTRLNTLGIGEGALISLDPRTGGVRALVSGQEPQAGTYVINPETQEQEGPFFYDYATIEALPPGSTFKLFGYGAALEKGRSPDHVYSCEPFQWLGESFGPTDWPDSSCGVKTNRLDMRTAMAYSDNLVALKVAQDAGLSRVVNLAKNLGIRSPLEESPRLVLGQSPVTLLEMTGAFGAVANQGKWNRPHLIQRIIDMSDRACRDNLEQYDTHESCHVLYSYEGEQALGLKPDLEFNRSVLRPEIAQNLTNLLAEVTAQGTAQQVDIPGAVGKTGTSDEARDLWFIGYVPGGDLVTGVWLGNKAEQRDPTQATSANAVDVWQKYMKSLGY